MYFNYSIDLLQGIRYDFMGVFPKFNAIFHPDQTMEPFADYFLQSKCCIILLSILPHLTAL